MVKLNYGKTVLPICMNKKSSLLIAVIILIMPSITIGDTQNDSYSVTIAPGESKTIGNYSMSISNPGNDTITAIIIVNNFNTSLQTDKNNSFVNILDVCNASDLNNDGTIDIYDITMVSTRIDGSPQTPYSSYDINKDGKIDQSDLDLMRDCINFGFRNDIITNISSEVPVIKTDISMDPSTDQIINQLILNIQALVDTNLTNKPKNIQLYVSEHYDEKENYDLVNNRSYFGKPLKVDMKQRGDFPFEDYNNTIFITSIDKNFTNETKFFINLDNQNQTIDAWGQPRQINFFKEGNKIEITMERTNKNVTKWLYGIGVVIILAYLISFYLIYRKSPYTSDMFVVFNSFSFLFFVALVIAGIRDYILVSFYAWCFMLLILIGIFILTYTRIKSRKKNGLMKQKDEKLKYEIKEILKRSEEKIDELKKMYEAESRNKDDDIYFKMN